uniref:cystathionine beta-synthase n=1 Tax=Mesocestoides corti TaxID=53468 RepID=A0A5K3F7T6_MESCO
MIASNVLDLVGDTPLVRLNKIPKTENVECEILAKCEFLNPGGSVKDRIGKRMVEEGERSGLYRPGDILIEPTSGNTGIGIAMTAAVKGYGCKITMPDKMSQEKSNILRGLGAEVIRTPRDAPMNDPRSHFQRAFQLKKELGERSHIPNQYSNPYNPIAHYDTTGPEILEACAHGEPDGKPRLDMIVVGAGTGGTVSGIGRFLKEKIPSCKIVAVEPKGSRLGDASLGVDDYDGPYEVEGIGYEFVPTVLDRKIVDHWVRVGDHDTFKMARRLMNEEGLLAGGSSGSVVWAAIQAIRHYKLGKGHRVVVILPDSARNYTSKFLSDDWLHASGFNSEPEANEFIEPLTRISVGKFLMSGKMYATTYLDSSVTIPRALALTGEDLALVTQDEKVVGVFSSKMALEKLLKGDCQPEDSIIKVADTQFRTVERTDGVDKIAHFLTIRPYVVVKSDNNDANNYLITSREVLRFALQFTKKDVPVSSSGEVSGDSP